MLSSCRVAALAFAALVVACGSSGSDSGACTGGERCTPVNACHVGRIDCATGACVDLGETVADGTACGTQRVCWSGACVAVTCVAGQDCQPENPCASGKATCETPISSPGCAVASNRPDGTTCGDGHVCSAGSCMPVVCTGGTPCDPANPCDVGETVCTSATAPGTCSPTGHRADGTSCGSNLVCAAGACVPVTCIAGQDCQPENPCTSGETTCQTPISTPGCAVTSSKPDGTACGTGHVCSGGACLPVVCTPGTACNPADPCDVGETVCTSPTTPGTCSTTGTKPDGTSCGTDLVCASGACVAACIAGQACQPTNPCASGQTECATSWASPTCGATGTQPDGTPCGTGMICSSGACVPADSTRPTVVSRLPAPGAADVFSRDPITVTFSEAVAPASLAGSVTLSSSAGAVAMTTALSADGRTLTLTPASLPIPTTLTATLSDRITDLAGNKLVVPADAWTWELASWVYLGTVAQDHDACTHAPSLAVDMQGRPTIGWVYTSSATCDWGPFMGEVGFARWAGQGWDEWYESPVIALGVDHVAEATKTALDSAGNPTIAWADGPPSNVAHYARAARWTGTQWRQYPDLHVDVAAAVSSVSIGINAGVGDDRLVIAWIETAGTVQRMYARRWTGLAWEDVTYASWGYRDEVVTVDTATGPTLSDVQVAFDATGEPVFYWRAVGPSSSGIAYASWQGEGPCDPLPSNLLMVAYHPAVEATCPVHQVYAIRTSEWVGDVYSKAAGAAAVGPLNINPSASLLGVAVDVDLAGTPVVAWGEREFLTDGLRERGYARRWSGSRWDDLGSFASPADDAGGLRLAIGPSGVPVATLTYFALHPVLFVLRSNTYAPPFTPIPLTFILINDAQGAQTTIQVPVTFHVAYTPANATDRRLTWTVCADHPVACSPDPTGHCRTCTPSTANGWISNTGVYLPPPTIPVSPLRVYVTACQEEQAICDWSFVDVYR